MRISDWSSDVCSSDLLPTTSAAQHPGRCRREADPTEPVRGKSCRKFRQLPQQAPKPPDHGQGGFLTGERAARRRFRHASSVEGVRIAAPIAPAVKDTKSPTISQSRSEEHTSELQSLMRISYA